MINLAVVDQSSLLTEIFTPLMRDHPEIRISGTYADPKEALNALPYRVFDIMAVSTNLPGDGVWKLLNGINIMIKASETNCVPRILIVGSKESREEVMRYIEAGAKGYVRQTDPPEELQATMHYMHKGEAKVSPDLALAMMARLWELANRINRNTPIRTVFINLTPREGEILQLLKQGLSNQEIAELLSIEVGTVKNHVHNILEKLGVSNRKQAAEHVLEDWSQAYRKMHEFNYAAVD